MKHIGLIFLLTCCQNVLGSLPVVIWHGLGINVNICQVLLVITPAFFIYR